MSFQHRHRNRGFTLVEVMVASAIASIVFVSIASMQSISARAAKDLYGETRTRSSRMQSLDQIRYRLVNAMLDSISVSVPRTDGPGYHRIQFQDLALGGAVSAFYFNKSTNTLYYDVDINDSQAARIVAVGPINVSFEPETGNAVIKLNVKSASHMRYSDIDLQDGETVVYIRNV